MPQDEQQEEQEMFMPQDEQQEQPERFIRRQHQQQRQRDRFMPQDEQQEEQEMFMPEYEQQLDRIIRRQCRQPERYPPPSQDPVAQFRRKAARMLAIEAMAQVSEE